MSGRPWRIGRHYGIHVYDATDCPVATFHREDDAKDAVAAINRGLVPDAEFVLMPPRGWLNRIEEELMKDGVESWLIQHLSRDLSELIRSWAVGLDNQR